MSRPKGTNIRINSQVAIEVNRLITLSPLTQRDIAIECNMPNPNLLTLIKQGLTKLPLDRVDKFAEVTGGDAAHLKELILREYFSEIMEAVESVFQGRALGQDELAIVKIFREERNEFNKAIREEAVETSETGPEKRVAKRLMGKLKLSKEAEAKLRKIFHTSLAG